MLLAVCHRFAFELEVRFRSDALIRCKVCTPALAAFWPGAAASLRCRRKPVLTAARKNLPASGRRVTAGSIVREALGVNLGAHLAHLVTPGPGRLAGQLRFTIYDLRAAGLADARA